MSARLLPWAISLLLPVILMAGPARAQEPRTIRIATEGAFPPFNLVENGEPAGFEIDLAREFCAEMRARCSFVLHGWDGITQDLIAGHYDAVVASLHITERRQRRIAFSRPYYRMPSSLITRHDGGVTSTDPAALVGKRIGVVDRSEQARFLEEVYAGAEIRPYAKLDEANLDLLTERLDLVAGDKLALTRFLASREGACCRLAADLPRDPRFFTEGVGVGLRKEDAELKETFDRAIVTVMADGRYDRIRKKYFSFDVK